MLQLIRYLLFPFGVLFYLIIRLRNFAYRKEIFKSKSYNYPIILVGNVLVGGTGKTPMVSYLLNLLQDAHKLASLSRGYGRKTKGFLKADTNATATTIGDEPLQLFQNFGKKVTVAVCEDRNTGVQTLMPEVDVIVMDDAFQHRKIKAGLQIVLYPFDSFQHPQWMLPVGNLREPWTSHQRAQVVVVSKCPPDLSVEVQENLKQKLQISPQQKVFFTTINYKNLSSLYTPQSFPLSELEGKNIILLTGIVQTQPITSILESYHTEIKHFKFKDHHTFNLNEIQNLIAYFHTLPKENSLIITTEKDAQRLKSTKIENLLRNLPVYSLPMEVNFLGNSGIAFDILIKNYVETYSRNRSVYPTKNAGV